MRASTKHILRAGAPSALALAAVLAMAGLSAGDTGQQAGLTSAGSQLWDQNSPGIPGVAEEDDCLGCALATGYFDADGIDDLAVGVSPDPYEPVSSAGEANVIYGSPPAPAPTSTEGFTATTTTEAPAHTAT